MFLKHLVNMGGFELNHHWHGIDILMVLECTLLAALICAVLSIAPRMKRKFRIAAILGAVAFSTAAYAANTALSALSASGAIAGTNLFYVVQTAGVGGVKATAAQVATYINSLFSGDATVASGGAVTLKNTGPGATGPIGSTTVVPVITIDAQGRVTALTSATAAGTVSSVTPGGGLVSGVTASCTQTAITGAGTLSEARCSNPQTGSTYTVLDTDRGKLVTLTNAAAIAVTLPLAGVASAFRNGWKSTFMNVGSTVATFTPTTSTINGAAAYRLFPGQSVTISSDDANYQIDPGTTGGVTISNQAGTNYPIVAGDFGKLVNLSNGSNQVPTLPNANTLGANWFVQACNIGAGTQTITPATSTIGGAATFVLPAASAARPACVAIVSDGTNYSVAPDFPMDASMLSAGTVPVARLPTGTSGGTLPLLNGNNTWSGTQTFGSVVGTVTTQSGTTYTLVAADCGTLIRFSNGSAVTVTIPQGLAVGCNIAIMQAGAGQVSVNGSAVTPATLQSAHSYTKTFGAGAIIGITTDASNHAVLTGDGA